MGFVLLDQKICICLIDCGTKVNHSGGWVKGRLQGAKQMRKFGGVNDRMGGVHVAKGRVNAGISRNNAVHTVHRWCAGWKERQGQMKGSQAQTGGVCVVNGPRKALLGMILH